MDEDDCSSSHRKGKRAAEWAISDDSDDVDKSDEGESESDDDGEDDPVNGEGDEDEDQGEDEDDDDDEEEEDEEAKVDGAHGETSADLEVLSSDEDSEKCPICLNSFTSQPVATPENCEHYFCFDCILEWAKNANSCPVDRLTFNNIYIRKCYGGKVKKMVTVQKPVKTGQEETVDLDLEQTNCEVCGGSDREDRLLLCDGCDAGYHMECLTPPLDSVPVEEWFCPECEATNRSSRGSAEELNDVEVIPSSARPATNRPPPRAVGPTRAIARTQQSERVRASVNRHRISQARSAQLAPTYLIQSTWLDETINAVVAGLNTAVYVRDITPRAPSGRRRKTGKRRKVGGKKTSVHVKKGKTSGTRVKRRKRRIRRTRSRKRLVQKKTPTIRGRIANNLGIVKDSKGSSVPTVYRPSEHTLSSMRADIGAASLSIYGDPFDFDPFVDHEEEEQQTHCSSLLEARRRGISRSALRSHQPVARPVTAPLSRRNVEMPSSATAVEEAPVPDLLGSILSGQSMLLMDSSNVIINRDGTLKAAKQRITSLTPATLKSSNSCDSSPGVSPNTEDSSVSPHNNGNHQEFPSSSVNRLLPHGSPHIPSAMSSSTNHCPMPDIALRGNHSFQPSCPSRSTVSTPPQGLCGVKAPVRTIGPSHHSVKESSLKSKEISHSHGQSKKTPVKPMWMDVSILPRIPKIKRENSDTRDDAGHCEARGNSQNDDIKEASILKAGMNNLSGGKGQKLNEDQQKGQADGQGHRHGPDRSGSSSGFSSSFSVSSSPANQSRHASSSSSSASSSVSFRINSSGNSWHARRLNIESTSAGGSIWESEGEREDDAKKKQLSRDKRVLLASRSVTTKKQDIYDPFNPTMSESGSSEEEVEESKNVSGSPPGAERRSSLLGDEDESVLSQQIKTEADESEILPEEPGTSQTTASQTVSCFEKNLRIKKEPELLDVKIEPSTLCVITEVKKEPKTEDKQKDSSGHNSLGPSAVKKEPEESTGHTSGTSSRSLFDNGINPPSPRDDVPKKTLKESSRSKATRSSKSPVRDSSSRDQSSKTSEKQKPRGSEKERDKRKDVHTTDQRSRKKEPDEDQSSRSREKRKAHSSSDRSQSDSPDRRLKSGKDFHGKDANKKRRSRSRSRSISKERSRAKKLSKPSRDGHDRREKGGERRREHKDKTRNRSRSKSRSRSNSNDRRSGTSHPESKSRVGDRREGHHSSLSTREKDDPHYKDKRRRRSRSRSRERRKEGSSRNTPRTTESSRDTNHIMVNRKEREAIKHDKRDERKKEMPSTFFSKEKKDKNVDAESQLTAIKPKKEIKVEKEFKKEESPPVDMFEDVSADYQENSASPLVASKNVAVVTERTIKLEFPEVFIKSEPNLVEVCPPAPFTSSPTTSTTSATQTLRETFKSEPIAEEIKTSIKQEPPDFGEEFSADGMLENMDLVKSEPVEVSCDVVKQEKKAEDIKEEGGQAAVVTVAKAKSQVKRVTWNIQEPEGPQPEKSASKLALYKLKLKQEGARRSLIGQTPNQDCTTAGNETSKKGVNDASVPSCSSDAAQLGEGKTEQGEAEGDLSRKDKYLKKLHMQERAVEEVKLAIKPFYQRRDINKEEYKEILRKAVQKVCHSKSGEINPVKVGNLVKAYVDKYKHARKHRKDDEPGKIPEEQGETVRGSDSP